MVLKKVTVFDQGSKFFTYTLVLQSRFSDGLNITVLQFQACSFQGAVQSISKDDLF